MVAWFTDCTTSMEMIEEAIDYCVHIVFSFVDSYDKTSFVAESFAPLESLDCPFEAPT